MLRAVFRKNPRQTQRTSPLACEQRVKVLEIIMKCAYEHPPYSGRSKDCSRPHGI